MVNILNRYKNVIYKLTPLGILFPALVYYFTTGYIISIKNNTEQVFITCRGLNDVKKALINSKIYGLLGIIDLKKINNWEEVKGQSIWINATLEDQKGINGSRYLCFPFTTKALNDLLSFSVY